MPGSISTRSSSWVRTPGATIRSPTRSTSGSIQASVTTQCFIVMKTMLWLPMACRKASPYRTRPTSISKAPINIAAGSSPLC